MTDARHRARDAVVREAERAGDTLVGCLAHGIPFTLSGVAGVEAGHRQDVRNLRMCVGVGILSVAFGLLVVATTPLLLPGLATLALGIASLAYMAFGQLPDVSGNLPSAAWLVEEAGLTVGVGHAALYVGSLGGERFSGNRPASVRKVRYDAIGDVLLDADGHVEVVDRAGRTVLTLVLGNDGDVGTTVDFVRSRIPA